MSRTSQVYSDFRAISELLTKLNYALITAKRVVFKTEPRPDQAEIEQARTTLLNFLTQQPAGAGARARGRTQPTRLGSPREFAVPMSPEDKQRCISQLQSGLAALDRQSLDSLETVVRQLGQSSEGLYRQMARL